jgi:hypothetical protein
MWCDPFELFLLPEVMLIGGGIWLYPCEKVVVAVRSSAALLNSHGGVGAGF